MTTLMGLAQRRGPSPRPSMTHQYDGTRDPYSGGKYQVHETSRVCSWSVVWKVLLVIVALFLVWRAYLHPQITSYVVGLRDRASAVARSHTHPSDDSPPTLSSLDPDLYLIVGLQSDPQFAQAVAFSWRLKDAYPEIKSRALAFPSREKYVAWLDRSREPFHIPLQFSSDHNVVVFKGSKFLGTGAALRSDAFASGFTLAARQKRLKKEESSALPTFQSKTSVSNNEPSETNLRSTSIEMSPGGLVEEKVEPSETKQDVTVTDQSSSASDLIRIDAPLQLPAQVTFRNKLITGYRATEGKKFTNYKPFAQVLEGWNFMYQAPLLASIILVQDQTSASTAMVRYPKALVNNIGWGGQSCLGGSKGTQIQCRMNQAIKDGCSYESLKIQPYQARLWIPEECKLFFQTRCEDEKTLFIQKPSGGQHGAGMKVHRGCGALKAEFESSCDSSGGAYTKKKYFIMPYLQPALLDGHKFDVRTYGLIASLDPLLIFYSDGFVRRATTKYSTDNLHDEAAHITNSIKQNAKDDHFWDFARLSRYLHETHRFPKEFMESLFRRRAMKVTEFVFQSARSMFKRKKGRFQLFALDWIVDHSGGVHLLEVNSNPLVGSPYPGLEHHFPKIWSELMTLVTDIQTGQTPTAKLKSPTLSNYWRLVFSEFEEASTYNSCAVFHKLSNPPEELSSTIAPEAEKSLEEIQRAVESELRDELVIAQEEDSEQLEANGVENAVIFKSLKGITEIEFPSVAKRHPDTVAIPCPSQAYVDESRKKCILAPGSEDETVFHIISSGRPGPVVFVIAGVHGNEGAGVVAARHVAAHWKPSTGILLVLERANARGVAANHRFVPPAHDSQFYDLNRAFGSSLDVSKMLVASIWELVSDARPDFLFDLHEGRAFFASSTSLEQQHQVETGGVLENVGSTTGGKVSKGNSIVTTINAENLAKVVAEACNENVEETSRRFFVMAPPIQGGLAAKVNAAFGTRAMLFESTLVYPLETRARQHLFMLGVALRSVGVLPADFDLSAGGAVEACVATRKTCSIKS